MADLTISNAASLTATTVARGDLIPLVDVSASAGSKGSNMTITELAKSLVAQNLFIPAAAMIPRTTNGCGVNSSETSTNKVNYDSLDFDAAVAGGSEEKAQFMLAMPSNYNAGTVTAKFHWTADSGSGGVVWALSGRAYADDDALDTAQGTAQSVADTLLAAGDMHITAATSAITIGGTPAANRPVVFEVCRLNNDASDTLAVDARLLGVEITFTAA